LEFSELNLHAELLEGIRSMNFTEATPIQEQAIPLILKGKDLIGVAQTGTGKTAAFVLPILNMVIDRTHEPRTKALVIVPTRELALQIDQAVEAYSYFTGASSIAIYGGGDGADFNQEKNAITSGVDIIIATPGRLISHMNVGYVDFSKLDFLVLDEADRMLDMGFQPDLQRIVRTINPDRQTLLFSATMADGIQRIARAFLKDPVEINIAISKPAEGVKQGAYVVYNEQKLQLVTSILNDPERKDQSIVVFSSSRQMVTTLYNQLLRLKLNVGMISSDLDQKEREKVMIDFRNRKTLVLVATDVISRGIDVEGIDMVVNFDVPRDAEDYVHRIGRTARAQRKGEALTFIGPADIGRFMRIEKLIGYPVEKIQVPERLGPVPEYKNHSGGHSGGGLQGGRRSGGGHSGGGNNFQRRKPNPSGPKKPAI
jgi:ATP-dependent RNA helicase RhlE